MDNKSKAPEEKQPSKSCCCFMETRVKGQLSDEWSDWFDGLEMKRLENGEMTLSGAIPDQAALMGILNKLHRLNLTILSVNSISPNQE